MGSFDESDKHDLVSYGQIYVFVSSYTHTNTPFAHPNCAGSTSKSTPTQSASFCALKTTFFEDADFEFHYISTPQSPDSQFTPPQG